MKEQSVTKNICRIGLVSSIATVTIGTVYDWALVSGLQSLRASDQPIGDPWFSLMEITILLMMLPLVMMFVAVRCLSSARDKIWCDLSIIFAALLAGLTCCVHFTILSFKHNPIPSQNPWSELLLTFQWPSIPYVLDILAWDVFFALAALFLAPAFAGSGLRRMIQILLTVSGVLALAGLSGVATGDMRFRMIGVVGYAVSFPVATALIGFHFYQMLSRPEKTLNSDEEA